MLKEIGLDDVPETMEAFIEAAKDRGTYSLNVSGVGDWDMYPYFWLFGGTLTDDGFTKATRLSGQRCQHRRHEQADRAARPEDLHHP